MLMRDNKIRLDQMVSVCQYLCTAEV